MVLSCRPGRGDPAALRRAAATPTPTSAREIRKLRDAHRRAAARSAGRPRAGAGDRVAGDAAGRRRRPDVDVKLALGAAGPRSPAMTESAIYRIVQEALTNVVKHAGAGASRLSVDQERSRRGRGRGRRLRLRSRRRHRASACRACASGRCCSAGSLSVSSAAGGPTRVSAGAAGRLGSAACRLFAQRASDSCRVSRGLRAASIDQRELRHVRARREQRRAASRGGRTATGAGAALAISERVGPRPSRRQRSDRPMTSRPAPAAAAMMPSPPSSTTTGSVAMPAGLLDEQAGVAEQRGSRDLPSSVCPAAPSSLSGAPVRRGEPRAQLQRRPVVLGAAERHEDRRVRGRQRIWLALRRDEHRRVARSRARAALPTSPQRHALADQPPAPVDQHAGRPPRARRCRRDRCPAVGGQRDAAGGRPCPRPAARADLVDRPRRRERARSSRSGARRACRRRPPAAARPAGR